MPTVVIQPDPTAGKDTYLNAGNTTGNYGTTTDLYVGLPSGINRSILQFDLSTIPVQSGIASATFAAYVEFYNANRSTNIHRITAPWTETGATWASRDGTNAWANAGGDYDATVEASFTPSAAGTWNNWTITSLVDAWVRGTKANYGLLVKWADESTGNVGNSYYSSDYTTDPTLRPKLTVTYTNPPTVSITTPNGTQSAPTQVNDTVTPDLSGVYSSADSVNMAYRQHQVYDEAGNLIWDSTKTAATATPGATVTVSVPAGYLKYGKKYKWKWMAWDANGGYSSWSSDGWFKPTLTLTPTATDLAAADHLYAITPDGQVMALDEGTTDLGTPIAWEWVSKAFTDGHMERRKKLKRIWVIADVPAGSTLAVAYSTRQKDLNDGLDWSTAYNFTTSTDVQRVKIPVPIGSTDASQSPWFRIKLSGTGPVTVYQITREFRIRRT